MRVERVFGRLASPVVLSLSASEARRAALAAQGFSGRRLGATGGRVDARHLIAAIDRIAVIQIDSVNVVCRSHELPLFSRLGPHPAARVRALYERDRKLFEYWAHEASLLPVELHPLLRWRMHAASNNAWGRMKTIARDKPGFVEGVLAEVAERGPLAASDLEDPTRVRGPWWSWGDAKVAIEYLFWSGQVTAAGRRSSFERLYDLPERVVPASVLAAPTPEPEAAKKTLLVRSARAIGVGAAPELADYFRINIVEARRLLAELAEDGALLPATVEGWREPAFAHPEVVVPGRVRPRALLSPLDSLIWHRPRTERLFGMKVRFEVYTPAPKRTHGYYVLPFLLGEHLVGRVDLKADRADATLRVKSAWRQRGHAEPRVAEALAAELGLLASHLGLERVVIDPVGDLAAALTRF